MDAGAARRQRTQQPSAPQPRGAAVGCLGLGGVREIGGGGRGGGALGGGIVQVHEPGAGLALPGLVERGDPAHQLRAGWAGEPSQALLAGSRSPFISTDRSPSWDSGSMVVS